MLHLRLKPLFIGLILASLLMLLLTFAALTRYNGATERLAETIAMNALKGRFDDAQSGFTRVGPPDLELARRLMHDDAYHSNKAYIMRPVDAFSDLATASPMPAQWGSTA